MILRNFELLFNDSNNFRGSILRGEKLSKHTSMNVGGPASLFIEPADTESLVYALKCCIEGKIEFFVLGGGSNVIFCDEGIDVVICTRKLNSIKSGLEGGRTIKVGAGAVWAGVIQFCKRENLGGFEPFTGLSGTVGGALFMNASCFGLSTDSRLLNVTYLDTDDFKIKEYKKNPADWAYKVSPFNDGKKIILEAEFSVTEGFDKSLSEATIASRREKGHFKAPSAGSVFKNDGDKIAGRLIDECGLKGKTVGGAQVAPWHANFIINPEGKATYKDVLALVELIKNEVYKKHGIQLKQEVLFIDKEFCAPYTEED